MFDPLPFLQNFLTCSEVNIRRGQILQRLMVPAVVVVVNKLIYSFFQILGRVIVVKPGHVFHGPVVPFDLSLGLGVERFSIDGLDSLASQEAFQFTRHITAPVVRKQPGGILLTDPGEPQRLIHRRHDIPGRHVGPEVPREDVSGIIVQDGGQIIPAPAHDLEEGEIGLPHLADPGGLVFKLIGGAQKDVGGCGDQPVALEDAVHAAFRDIPPVLVNDMESQLPG